MMRQTEELALLLRILDPEDYRFIRAYDFRIETRFRRARMRIYREGLRAVASGIAESYQARLQNLSASGRWTAYPGLVQSTASMYLSLVSLWAAGMLFQWRLPLLVDVSAKQRSIEKFLTAPSCPTPDRLPS